MDEYVFACMKNSVRKHFILAQCANAYYNTHYGILHTLHKPLNMQLYSDQLNMKSFKGFHFISTPKSLSQSSFRHSQTFYIHILEFNSVKSDWKMKNENVVRKCFGGVKNDAFLDEMCS